MQYVSTVIGIALHQRLEQKSGIEQIADLDILNIGSYMQLSMREFSIPQDLQSLEPRPKL